MSMFEVYHIPEFKNLSGFKIEECDKYKITFSSGKKLFFSRSHNGYFAVSGRYWTDRSFEGLIKNYNKGSLAVQSFLKNRNIELFDYTVFSEDEIKEAITMWDNNT
jgi:hypothetical protein